MTIGSWVKDSSGISSSKSWNGKDGRSSDNPYTSTSLFETIPSFEYRSRVSGWKPCTSKTFGISLWNPSAAYWNSLQVRALNRLMGKYKQHDFNAGTFLAELPETARAVASAGISIFKAYREVRKGRFHKALTILRKANAEKGRTFTVDKTSSSSWLALQFGWIPLVGDAYSAADAFKKGAMRPKSVSIRSHATIKVPIATGGTAPGMRMYVGSIVQTYTKRVILKTRYRPSPWEQLGLTNPALIAWEVTPFSFLVDYFIGIGNFLELHTVLPSSSSQYIETQFFRGTQSGINQNPDRSGYWFRPTTIPYRGVDIRLTRSVSGSPTIPPPQFKNPFLKLNQVANMIALGISLKS